MKKKLTSIIALAMILPTLAACSGGSAPEESTTAANSSAPAANTEAAIQEIFEEIILVDDDNCTFKITAIEDNTIFGYTMKAQLENKTDLELMFSLANVSVNGFMRDPFWAASVTPGMKSNEEISFSDTDFARNGITDITEIEFTLNVYDNNDWAADHLVEEIFTIYPKGEDAVESYIRTAQEGEIILFDDENCTMIVTGFDPDNTWGYTLNVYLENKTDKNLMFSIGDAAVNGYMCDPFWAETVAAGKRSNTTISWSESDFEDNGITEVESLTLPIRVYDADNWTEDDLISETFTINP